VKPGAARTPSIRPGGSKSAPPSSSSAMSIKPGGAKRAKSVKPGSSAAVAVKKGGPKGRRRPISVGLSLGPPGQVRGKKKKGQGGSGSSIKAGSTKSPSSELVVATPRDIVPAAGADEGDIPAESSAAAAPDDASVATDGAISLAEPAVPYQHLGMLDPSWGIEPAKPGVPSLRSFCSKWKPPEKPDEDKDADEDAPENETAAQRKKRKREEARRRREKAREEREERRRASQRDRTRRGGGVETVEPAEEEKDQGPMVEINEAGEIIVKESSMVVNARKTAEEVDRELTAEGGGAIVEEDTDVLTATYNSFVQRTKPQQWTVDETRLFYRALRQCGTDFAMMTSFFKKRTRKQIKSKYNTESRKNPKLIDLALRPNSKLDLDLSVFGPEVEKDVEKAPTPDLSAPIVVKEPEGTAEEGGKKEEEEGGGNKKEEVVIEEDASQDPFGIQSGGFGGLGGGPAGGLAAAEALGGILPPLPEPERQRPMDFLPPEPTPDIAAEYDGGHHDGVVDNGMDGEHAPPAEEAAVSLSLVPFGGAARKSKKSKAKFRPGGGRSRPRPRLKAKAARK